MGHLPCGYLSAHNRAHVLLCVILIYLLNCLLAELLAYLLNYHLVNSILYHRTHELIRF